jgi:peptidoglycan/LPS O-acetylase OafA/YrhL
VSAGVRAWGRFRIRGGVRDRTYHTARDRSPNHPRRATRHPPDWHDQPPRRVSDKPGFRPDLQGLRAVAVLLVLLYHARIPGFGGGYVGVDVFFVLSGFLITGLIVREMEATGRLDLPGFYARRARRLLPAAGLVLAVTMVASVLVLPPLRVPDVAGDVIASALYASNIRFALQATDYLGSTLPPSPVLHYWSLGVEEQFYLFWPALLTLAAGAAFRIGRPALGLRRLAVVLAVVFVASLGMSLWLTSASPAWAFFSLPTRAWELALGALLAMPIAARLVPGRATPLAGWAGLAMILAAGVVFDETTPFPGTAALLPTVGSALVIAAGLRTTARAPGALGDRLAPWRVLALRPLPFIGLISYSLYLWHWPILILPEAAAGEPLRAPARIALVGVAILLAVVTQRWVEDPLRHGRFVGLDSRRSLALAGALSVGIVLTSASLAFSTVSTQVDGPVLGGDIDDVPLPPDPTAGSSSSGTTGELSPSGSGPDPTVPAVLQLPSAGPVPADLVPPIAEARHDLPVIYSDGCHADVTATRPGECVYGDTDSSTTVVLFGDSHAAQWFPALERLARTNGWRLVSLTKSACTTADVTVWNSIVERGYTECDEWREASLDRIESEQPALVVVSNSRGYQVMVDGTPVPAESALDVWDAATKRTLERLRPLSADLVVIGDTPRSTADPPVCLSDHVDDATACALPYAKAVNPSWTAGEAAVAAALGVTFVDPTAWVCRTDPCPAVLGRLLVFRDQHHLTATYARALAERLGGRLPDLQR